MKARDFHTRTCLIWLARSLTSFCRPSPPATSARLPHPTCHRTTLTMVTPLSFKGDKKVKKRKRVVYDADLDAPASKVSSSKSLATTNTDATADDDSWVNADAPTDISGPIIVVLPSDPPTCLACDALGKVFCSQIENCVENDPATAEPHDVRQVWVATRIAGTESFSLKGHHGR